MLPVFSHTLSTLQGLYDCCFCLEPLAWSPVLQLTCGHVVHVSCARARLSAGWPGPELSFHFLFCPLCGSGSEGRCGNIQVGWRQQAETCCRWQCPGLVNMGWITVLHEMYP
jgi:hypothetical protein